MKKHILLSVFFLFLTNFSFLYAQEISPFSKAEIIKANSAADVSYLNEDEKKVILLINLARLDGKRFYNYYLPQYVEKSPFLSDIKENSYLKSLKKDLFKTKKLPMLMPNKILTDASLKHADDMGKSGKTGHESSNGTSFSDRMTHDIKNFSNVGENCDYGFSDPMMIVCHLLEDKGVKSLGHRKNILGKSFDKIGVAIEPHKVYKTNCVMIFSAE